MKRILGASVPFHTSHTKQIVLSQQEERHSTPRLSSGRPIPSEPEARYELYFIPKAPWVYLRDWQKSVHPINLGSESPETLSIYWPGKLNRLPRNWPSRPGHLYTNSSHLIFEKIKWPLESSPVCKPHMTWMSELVAVLPFATGLWHKVGSAKQDAVYVFTSKKRILAHGFASEEESRLEWLLSVFLHLIRTVGSCKHMFVRAQKMEKICCQLFRAEQEIGLVSMWVKCEPSEWWNLSIFTMQIKLPLVLAGKDCPILSEDQ